MNRIITAEFGYVRIVGSIAADQLRIAEIDWALDGNPAGETPSFVLTIRVSKKAQHSIEAEDAERGRLKSSAGMMNRRGRLTDQTIEQLKR